MYKRGEITFYHPHRPAAHLKLFEKKIDVKKKKNEGREDVFLRVFNLPKKKEFILGAIKNKKLN